MELNSMVQTYSTGLLVKYAVKPLENDRDKTSTLIDLIFTQIPECAGRGEILITSPLTVSSTISKANVNIHLSGTAGTPRVFHHSTSLLKTSRESRQNVFPSRERLSWSLQENATLYFSKERFESTMWPCHCQFWI